MQLSELVSGKVLLRSAASNLLGRGLPIVVGILAIPIVIDSLGKERFGILGIIWMVVGYFSLFDLGLGRALTQSISKQLGEGRLERIRGTAWTALALMLLLGLAGLAAMLISAPWLVQIVMRTAPDVEATLQLKQDALKAFTFLAFSIPVVISSAGMRGILEAHQRFGTVNAVRVATGTFTFLGPLLVVPFTNSLVPIVIVLTAGRVVATTVLFHFCRRVLATYPGRRFLGMEPLKPLLRFGGWMTVTNLVTPAMIYVDRFLIGGLVSLTAVAFYITPYEAVTRLFIIPSALLGVFFPALSATMTADPEKCSDLFAKALKFLLYVMFPATLLLFAFSRELLGLWVGEEFALNSTLIMQALLAGVLINSLAQAPYILILSAGRPRLSALSQLIQLPLYVTLLYWMISRYGAEGAAVAWTVRITLDLLVLCFLASRAVRLDFRRLSSLLPASAIVPAAFAIAWFTEDLLLRTSFAAAFAIGYPIWVWTRGLDSQERRSVRQGLEVWRRRLSGVTGP